MNVEPGAGNSPSAGAPLEDQMIRRTKVRMLRRFLEKIEQEVRILLSEEESESERDNISDSGEKRARAMLSKGRRH